MKIKILGGGWYGCHLAASFLSQGREVVLYERGHQLFSGASGANPARLHLGFHYPRSKLTRAMCQENQAEFMRVYGHLTHAVPINIYAVAAHASLVDFGTYCDTLRNEVSFVPIVDPGEFGLRNVEGALLTGERHIDVPKARSYFESLLESNIRLNEYVTDFNLGDADWSIDCTFCSGERVHGDAIDRFEPCVVGLLAGNPEKAVTIMDGPFPSVYPWANSLSSISSARWTPISKEIKSYYEAEDVLLALTTTEIADRVAMMVEDMAFYYPAIKEYKYIGARTAVRALPRSGADARLVEVTRPWLDHADKPGERMLRVRAGKIDAVFHAERLILEIMANEHRERESAG